MAVIYNSEHKYEFSMSIALLKSNGKCFTQLNVIGKARICELNVWGLTHSKGDKQCAQDIT